MENNNNPFESNQNNNNHSLNNNNHSLNSDQASFTNNSPLNQNDPQNNLQQPKPHDQQTYSEPGSKPPQKNNTAAIVIGVIITVFILFIVSIIAIITLFDFSGYQDEFIFRTVEENSFSAADAIECSEDSFADCQQIYLTDVEEGLYTVVFDSTEFSTYESYFYLNLNLEDYLNFERSTEYMDITDYFGFTTYNGQLTIENVPLNSLANIEIFTSVEDYSIEIIPQDVYIEYQDETSNVGFYPVGESISSGEYSVDETTYYFVAEIVPVSYDDYETDEEYYSLYVYEGDFELEDDEMLVIYEPYTSIEK